MATAWARDRVRPFYLAFAGMAVAGVLIAFSTTYFIPGPRGTLDMHSEAAPQCHLGARLVSCSPSRG